MNCSQKVATFAISTIGRPHGARPVLTLLALLLTVSALGTAGLGATTAKQLPLHLYEQQEPNWCWAASGAMIMDYLNGYTPPLVEQCQEATEYLRGFNSTASPCCPFSSNGSTCNVGGWPTFSTHGFAFQRTSQSALSWASLINEIDHNRPVAFSWYWLPAGNAGGHMMVALGYVSNSASGNQVSVYNPLRKDYEHMAYSNYVSGNDHSHWDDFWNIRRQAP